MKKILLASTILVGSAGVAAADNANFTFSGSAYFGVAYFSGNTVITATNFSPEISSSFTVGMVTTTDMGLEAGASITVDAAGWSFEDDNTATGTTGFGFLNAYTAAAAGSISDAKVYLSGDFGRFDAIFDANGAGSSTPDFQLKYSNTFGDFGVEASYWVAPNAGATNGDFMAKGTYTFGDYSVYADYMWDNAPGEHELGFGGSASMSGFTASVDVDVEDLTGTTYVTPRWGVKIAGAYTTGAISLGAFAQNEDLTSVAPQDDNWDFGADASYDLGGGVSLDGAVIYDGYAGGSWLAKAGVSMSF